jgi:hypothetical protein
LRSGHLNHLRKEIAVKAKLCALVLVAAASVLAATASAQTPLGTAITYQGLLKYEGQPVQGPTVDLVFRLYNVPAGGTALGTNTLGDWPINDGLFTAVLDFGDVFNGDVRWLEPEVNGETLDRLELRAVPYALFSEDVSAPLDLSDTQSGSFVIRGANASTGTGSSGVFGEATAASGTTYGVYGRTASTDGKGVYGFATAASGTNYGVYGESWSGIAVGGRADAPTGSTYGGWFTSSSTDGRGVYGYVSAGTGTTYGGYFLSSSTDGTGVFSIAGAGTGTTHGGSFLSSSTSGTGVYGLASAGTGTTYGVYGRSNSTDGTGVYGLASAVTGSTYGGRFESASTSGKGVYGYASAVTGSTYGGRFESVSTSGKGVYGYASAGTGTTYGGRFESVSTSGTGAYCWASAGTGTTYGVYGRSNSTDGTGVYGYTSASSGDTYGGYFQSASDSGVAVYGKASNASGAGADGTYGGYFECAANKGAAVYGKASNASGTGYGGYFETASNGIPLLGYATNSASLVAVAGIYYGTNGSAVEGEANAFSGSARGVSGYTNSPSGYGVFGAATQPGVNNYGVYFENGLAGTGTKAFQMDHPLDPENFYLNHYCTEGPEPLNAYSGNIMTDAGGYATVVLPDYFEEINRDFRYQLTVIDDSEDFVQAKVAREVENNQFVIRTSKPLVEVSWRVEAVRNDAWVRAYGAPVEVEKPEELKGKYLSPELYGKPAELGIHYHVAPQPLAQGPAEPPIPAEPDQPLP